MDQGIDNPVELGVKFYSEVGGTIKGVRYYKSRDNTGTHVGNLWSSSGTLLASAPFVDETISGWQQANFATPVPINSFTVYVASYHTNVGHYSANPNYFSSIGADNSPLHAPVNGGSWGVNGVYAYGANSTFPNQSFNCHQLLGGRCAQPGPPPTLTSIAVTPANPTVLTGATQQFTATGTYSDGSTQNITSQVSWNSSTSAVATINASGLASGVSAGSTTISATQSGVTGLTTLTVQTAPLAITTSSLPNGTVNVAYSATLAASGGTALYLVDRQRFFAPWPDAQSERAHQPARRPPSVRSASPRGSPVRRPNRIPSRSASSSRRQRPRSGRAVRCQESWTAEPDNPVELGVKFRSDVAGTVTWDSFLQGQHQHGNPCGESVDERGRSVSNGDVHGRERLRMAAGELRDAGGDQRQHGLCGLLPRNTGHYSDNPNYFSSSGVDNAPLHALANSVSGANGVYQVRGEQRLPKPDLEFL